MLTTVALAANDLERTHCRQSFHTRNPHGLGGGALSPWRPLSVAGNSTGECYNPARPSDLRPAVTRFCFKGADRMGQTRLKFLGVVAATLVLVAACGGSSGGGTPTKT